MKKVFENIEYKKIQKIQKSPLRTSLKSFWFLIFGRLVFVGLKKNELGGAGKKKTFGANEGRRYNFFSRCMPQYSRAGELVCIVTNSILNHQIKLWLMQKKNQSLSFRLRKANQYPFSKFYSTQKRLSKMINSLLSQTKKWCYTPSTLCMSEILIFASKIPITGDTMATSRLSTCCIATTKPTICFTGTSTKT
jgi:hypothetical protein